MPTLKFFLFFSFLSILFLFDLIIANCQTTSKIDSLLTIVENQKDDTNKVKTFLLVSQEYDKIGDFNKCLDYCDYSYDLAFRLNYNAGKIDALLSRSNYLIQTISKINEDGSKTYFPEDTSFQLALIALKMSDSINDITRRAASYTMLGRIFLNEEGPSSSRKYFYDAYKIYQKIEDSVGYMNFLRGFGYFYNRQAKYDSAIFYFKQSIEFCKKQNNEQGLGKGFYALGETYYAKADFGNAKFSYKESIKHYNKANYRRDDIYVKQAYQLLSMLAHDENKIDELLNYYIEQCDEFKNNYRQGVLKNNIGMLFFDVKKDYYNAIKYYSESKDLFKEFLYNKPFYLIEYLESYGRVAQCYYYLNNYYMALKILDTITLLYKNPNLHTYLNESYWFMSKIYEKTGNYRMAYEKYKIHYNWRDSIANRSYYTELYFPLKRKFINKIDEARLLSLENENLSLTKDIEVKLLTNQRNAYFYLGVGLILIISLIFIFYRNKAIKEKIITFQKIYHLEEEKKLLAAKAIVEGQELERVHIARELDEDLGTLLSKTKMQIIIIREKSPENSLMVEKAANLIDQAYGDVKKISYNMMPAILTKYGIYDTLKNLFESLNLIEGVNANLNIRGEQSRPPENIEIMIYRIIQEMVNNTLKHAEAKNIYLDIHSQLNELKLEYFDDGKGFDPEVKLTAGAIGLNSIQSRVKFINGEINLKSGPGQGVRYTIRIPLGEFFIKKEYKG